MTGPALFLVPDEADTVRRLQSFRERNPDIDVQPVEGAWQAAMEAEHGNRRILRHYRLSGLLDLLDRRFPPPDITALTRASRRAAVRFARRTCAAALPRAGRPASGQRAPPR